MLEISENQELNIENVLSATFAIEGDVIDVELILPIDKKVESAGDYTFKDKIKIVNAIVAEYKGNPVGLQTSLNYKDFRSIYDYLLYFELFAV